MSRPQAVIFDIGNVLIGWDPEGYYDAKIGPEARRRFFDEVPIHAANVRMDAGEPFGTCIAPLAEAHPEWRDEIMDWQRSLRAMLQPVIFPSVALMRALRRKGVPVFALSNWGDEHFEIATGYFDFLAEFDRAFVSGKLRLIKPDPEIYAVVERETGIDPASLLFVDDKAENVAAAVARGWRAHQFESWQGWAKRLVAEGLLSKSEAGL
jgi:2-haloacid dehalogenase